MPALFAGSSLLLAVVAATARMVLVAVVSDCLAGHREVSVVVEPF